MKTRRPDGTAEWHRLRLSGAWSSASRALGNSLRHPVLEALRAMHIESHLVISKAGDQTRALETDHSAADAARAGRQGLCAGRHRRRHLERIVPDHGHDRGALLGAHPERDRDGMTSSLVARAADVCLKERRRVVLMFRETPLHAGHIKSMLAVTEMGAIVAVPVPGLLRPAAHASTTSSAIRSPARSICSGSTPRHFRGGPDRPASRNRSRGARNDAASHGNR